MPIAYRRLERGDEEAYRRVHLESLKTFPDNFGTLHEDQIKVQKLQFEEFIETGTVGSFVFGAFADNELIGIAGFKRGDRPKTKHRGEIVQVFVNRDFQGQKSGRIVGA